jgi:hypothetical protein
MIMFRLIDLTAKENALDDCLATVKKAYEKDLLTLPEFISVSLHTHHSPNLLI